MDLPAEIGLPEPPAPPPARSPANGWSPIFAPLALLAGFGAAIFGGAIIGLLAALAGASITHPPAVVELLATLLQDVLFVSSAVYFAARAARPRPGDFGLRATQVGRALVLMVGAYVAFLVFAAVWEAILGLNDKEQVVQQLGANDSAIGLVAVVALTCVVAPICEEFFFRGFFFPAVTNWRGPWTAAVVTGIVFGAIHVGSAPVGDLVPLAFFGFLLCLLRWWSGSLYPCIAVHAINNCVAFGVSEHWHDQIAVLLIAVGLGIAATLGTVARVLPAQ
ncbi:MAG TPA: type II CAAX endopeptidase family protein [Solirubrobacteraceae bacterium]